MFNHVIYSFYSHTGYYNMAVGNISGSNTFEIVVCLGMVWFLKSLSNHFEPVLLNSRGFPVVASVLLLSFIISLSLFAFYGWVMKRKTGLIALVIYIVFLILVTVTEYYANQTQPTCQSGPLWFAQCILDRINHIWVDGPLRSVCTKELVPV